MSKYQKDLQESDIVEFKRQWTDRVWRIWRPLPTPVAEPSLIFKDFYTSERLQSLGLNKRQIKAVLYVKERGRITNREY